MVDVLAPLDPLQNVVGLADQLGRAEDADRAALDLPERISEHALGGGVPAQHDPVERLPDDRIVRRLHDVRELAQRVLRLAPIADVLVHDEDIAAGSAGEMARRSQHGDDRPVLAPPLHFDGDALSTAGTGVEARRLRLLRSWHDQLVEVLADRLARREAEQLLELGVDAAYAAVASQHRDCHGSAGEHGIEVGPIADRRLLATYQVEGLLQMVVQ